MQWTQENLVRVRGDALAAVAMLIVVAHVATH